MSSTAVTLVRGVVLGEHRRAVGPREWNAVCILGGERFWAGEANETPEGHICDECARHPRFDTDWCPDCGSRWSETIQPCPGCGLTVAALANRLAWHGGCG